MNKKDKFFLAGAIIFIVALITFSLYHNACWYPEKKRCIYTIELHYQSGRDVVNQYDLPKGTQFGVYIKNHKYGESNTYLRYHFSKPFGNESGYIAFDVDDYKIIKIEDIK